MRFKISRGGVFDETPTFAVCVDPLAEPVAFTVEHGRPASGCAPRRCVVSLWPRPVPARRPPRRRQRRWSRRRRRRGRYWAYATLNDAFAIRRRCRAGGRDLRARREDRRGTTARAATSRSGTPTCSSRGQTAEFIARPRRRTTRAPTGTAPSSTRTTSRSRSSTTTPTRPGTMAASFVDNGYRAQLRLRRRRRVRDPLRGRPVHRVRLRRPGHAGDPRGVHLAHRPDARRRRCGRSATTSAAGSTTRRTRSRRSARGTASSTCPATRSGSTSTTWTATASSPGTPTRFPDAPGMLERLARAGLPRDHDHRPGREVRARLRGLRPRARARRVVPDRGRRRLHRPGLAGRHRVPRLRHRGGARLVGRAQRRARAVRARRHLERHERAGHRRHPARAACASTAASARTSATTTSTRC